MDIMYFWVLNVKLDIYTVDMWTVLGSYSKNAIYYSLLVTPSKSNIITFWQQ